MNKWNKTHALTPSLSYGNMVIVRKSRISNHIMLEPPWIVYLMAKIYTCLFSAGARICLLFGHYKWGAPVIELPNKVYTEKWRECWIFHSTGSNCCMFSKKGTTALWNQSVTRAVLRVTQRISFSLPISKVLSVEMDLLEQNSHGGQYPWDTHIQGWWSGLLGGKAPKFLPRS